MNRRNLRVLLFGAGTAAVGFVMSGVLAGLTVRSQHTATAGTATRAKTGRTGRTV